MDTAMFDFHTAVTLDENQGHPNWYHNVEPSHPHHSFKFERNWLINVWMLANDKVFFFLDEIK